MSDACTDLRIEHDLQLVQKHFAITSMEYEVLCGLIQKTKEYKQKQMKIRKEIENDTFFKDQVAKPSAGELTEEIK